MIGKMNEKLTKEQQEAYAARVNTMPPPGAGRLGLPSGI